MAKKNLTNAERAAKSTRDTVAVPFSKLTKEQLNAFILNNPKAPAIRVIQHLLMQRQLDEYGGVCPECGEPLTWHSQSATTDVVVCSKRECKFKLPAPTRHTDKDGRQIYAVNIPVRHREGDKWVNTVKSVNPFAKNGPALPAVIFMIWGIIRGYIPTNFITNKDRGGLEEIARVMKGLDILRTMDEDDLVDLGTCAILLTKDPQHGGLGKDFLGVVKLPKDLKKAEREWPDSKLDAFLREEASTEPEPKPESEPEPEKKAWKEDPLKLQSLNSLHGVPDLTKLKAQIESMASVKVNHNTPAAKQVCQYIWVLALVANTGDYTALYEAEKYNLLFDREEALKAYTRYAPSTSTNSITRQIEEIERGGITEEYLQTMYRRGIGFYYPGTEEVFWTVSAFQAALEKDRGYKMPVADIQKFFIKMSSSSK